MLVRALALSIALPLALLPLAVQGWLGALIGELARTLLAHRRRVVRANLEIAFPALSPAARTALERAHWRHLGCVLIDTLQQPALRLGWLRARKIRIRGGDALEAARAEAGGRGILYLCSHLGSWEACAAVATLPGVRLVSVYKASGGWLDGLVMAVRQGFPQVLVEKHAAGRALVTAVKDGSLLGLISDQGGHTKYPFFGRPAYFPDGLGHFVARFRVPVVVAVALRAADGAYDLHLERFDPGPLEGLDRAAIEDRVTRAWVARLEQWIARAPEQYYWVHDVWRTFKDD